jgi:hypothetical protein
MDDDPMTATRAALFGLMLLATVTYSGAAQQRGGGCQVNGGMGGNRVRGVYPNATYDGKFSFARVFYQVGFGGGGDPPWHHDYNRAETHFSKLLTNLTKIKAHTTESVVLGLDDPEIFKYPILYLSEPGFWSLSDAEATGLRKHLQKGGFLIFDDFYDRPGRPDIYNLIANMERVIPGMRLIELDTNHPVFDSFYRVKSLDYYHPYYCIKSQFFGIFQDNDPKKRLLAIVNNNNDIGEAWEWSDQGMFAIDISNDAYKLGINYIIYAMTR